MFADKELAVEMDDDTGLSAGVFSLSLHALEWGLVVVLIAYYYDVYDCNFTVVEIFWVCFLFLCFYITWVNFILLHFTFQLEKTQVQYGFSLYLIHFPSLSARASWTAQLQLLFINYSDAPFPPENSCNIVIIAGKLPVFPFPTLFLLFW